MPKNKFQTVIFTLLMSFCMVYVMICYNICLHTGGLSNHTFLIAFHELLFMWPIAFVLELLVVDRIAQKMAFSFVTQKDRPMVIIIAISSMIVMLMCPLMSLVATILINQPTSNIFATFVQTTALNFPVALLTQLFLVGPIVLKLFQLLFARSTSAVQAQTI